MTEQHVVEQLHDYLDGLLTATGREEVERHLGRCPSCRDELASIEAMLSIARKIPREIEPPRDLWPAIAHRIDSRVQSASDERRALPSRPATQRKWYYSIAAILAVLVVGSLGYWYVMGNSATWQVERLEGTPHIDGDAMAEKDKLHVGDWLETDERSRAMIKVGLIGRVEVEPNSRLHLVDASATNHRLAMPRGIIRARIMAPPRLFFVETPSALAVDLGCAYTLSVDSSGSGLLRVESGWVSLEYRKRESIVPGGAVCYTRAGFGPGTPFFPDAARTFQSALQQLDFGSASEDALATVLSQARGMDAITLWHLLFRVHASDKARVYDRLTELVPPPEEATKSGVLADDREMLDAWRRKLNLGAKDWW